MPRTGRSFEVEAEIATLIKSGDWSVGYRIGTMHEIAEQFRCSRSDVNRALVSLRDRGMVRIEREPGGRSNCAVVIGVGKHLRTAYAAIFSRGVPIHELNPGKIHKLDAAIENAEAFMAETIRRLDHALTGVQKAVA